MFQYLFILATFGLIFLLFNQTGDMFQSFGLFQQQVMGSNSLCAFFVTVKHPPIFWNYFCNWLQISKFGLPYLSDYETGF